jgi:putative ABC transport system permease protein
VRDGLASAVARPVATATAAVVVALVCVVVLVTTGRTAAVEREVVAAVDGTGTRTITVTDASGEAGISRAAVAAIGALDGVEWAVGLGPAQDARAVDGASGVVGVPLREYVGDLPPELVGSRGRMPQADGEAVAGTGAAAQLGLLDGAGPVATGSGTVAVVGEVHARGSLSRLDDTVLVRSSADDDGSLRYVYVLADSAAHVPALADAVRAVLPAAQPAQVDVATSDGVLRLREVVSGSLGAGARQLMAGVLGAGVVLIGVTMLGAVSARRRDFGRQRALGASRSAIVVLVLVQSGLAAGCGAVVGTAGGLVAVRLTTGELPSWSFAGGLAALTVLVALVGSVPPALAAAWRDPVRVLRVP